MSDWMETSPAYGSTTEASISCRAGEARASLGASALLRMLDIVDYGMLMVVENFRVLFANQLAREELDDEHPLMLRDGALQVRNPRSVATLQAAVAGALNRNAQTMVGLPALRGGSISVSVVPLRDVCELPAALLVFEKRQVCEELSTDAFARAHALTLAETRVLKQLCSGIKPSDIADALGVKLTTVRTQIGSIRAKIGSRDISDILRRVSRLPPLPCLMRRA